MPQYDLIVIGASAGGVQALTQLAAGLPRDFPVPVLLVVHIPPYAVSNLPAILSNAGPVPATHAQDGEVIQSRHIYIAPPNHHLLVEDGRIRLSLGVRVNRVRPAVDPLFLSAAKAYGSRVIGIVLSGMLDDGTVGLRDIQRQGGLTLVQDPEEALFPSMPKSAIAHVAVDHILPSPRMGRALSLFVQDQSIPEQSVPEHSPLQQTPYEKNREHPPLQNKNELHNENEGWSGEGLLGEAVPAFETVEHDISAQEQNARDGMLTIFTCPECGGALWEADSGTLIRFRCHTGHVLSGESLFVGQAESIEKSLWYAARSLRDKARLARQLGHNLRRRGSEGGAARFEAKAQADDAHADMLEQMIKDNAAVDQSLRETV